MRDTTDWWRGMASSHRAANIYRKNHESRIWQHGSEYCDISDPEVLINGFATIAIKLSLFEYQDQLQIILATSWISTKSM